MPITLDRTPDASTLHLEGEIDISLAAELKQLLLESLTRALPVHVDLQQASTLNITAIQLLRAAERHAAELGCTFTIDGPIPAMIATALSLAGLELPLTAHQVAAA
ncbi:MAG: STAS domain-containing protein [Acidobacteriota bacterium]